MVVAVLRDLAARRHFALDLEPQALEIGGGRRRPRGRELPQPFVARQPRLLVRGNCVVINDCCRIDDESLAA